MKRSGTSVPVALKNVPPFPPVAAKLLAILSTDSVQFREVADLIGTDATFTARILQRVNSIEFGLTSPVSNIQQAVAFLGIDLTRQIAVTHATGLYAKEALKTEDLRRCWRHMVATAVLAEVIADACGVFSNVAFTAGMIHDIGRLGLLMAYPQEYERVVSSAAERCLDVLDFETEEFGMHHAEAGRLLAERWGLPEEFAVITGRHHDPCEGGEVDLLRMVHVACRLADVLGYDFVRPLVQLDFDTVMSSLPVKARARLHATQADLSGRIEARIVDLDSTTTNLPAESSALLSQPAAETSDSEEPADQGSLEVQGPPCNNRLARTAFVSTLLIGLVAVIWKLM